jgi:hypothetical protein
MEKNVDSPLVRLGGNFDGSYYIPQIYLNKVGLLISIGLGGNVTFESDILINNPSVVGKLIDKEINTMKLFYLRPLKYFLQLNKFKFYYVLKQCIDFYFIRKYGNLDFVNKFVDKNNFNDLLDDSVNLNLRDDKIKILKIDIEGGEWDLLDEIENAAKYFDLLLIEFHNCLKNVEKLEQFLCSPNNFWIPYYRVDNDGLGKTREGEIIEIGFCKTMSIFENSSLSFRHLIPSDWENLKIILK